MVGVYRRLGDEVVDAAGKIIHSDQQQQFADHVQPPTAISAWSATPAGRKKASASAAAPISAARRPEELAEATRSVTCYAGHYEVKGDAVHHHIEMALNPSLIGTR